LSDLIAAETQAQQQQALRLMQGGLSRLAERWRTAIVRALALVEAEIDFADEDLPGDLLATVAALLEPVRSDMRAHLRGSRAAERIRDGFEVALVGAPNVGKSTLLNALAGRPAALTSEVAGTTRDVIEVRMDADGLPVTLLDLAGLRPPEEHVEALGVALARERADRADLRLFLVDEPADVGRLGVAERVGDLVVRGKADLRPQGAGLAVSGLTGAGIDALMAAVAGELAQRASMAGGVTRERQRQAVARAEAALGEALEMLQAPELAAAELRSALRALDFLVGRVDVEAVLDVIFQNFCIGK
jgi:tRNA modification GTPase